MSPPRSSGSQRTLPKIKQLSLWPSCPVTPKGISVTLCCGTSFSWGHAALKPETGPSKVEFTFGKAHIEVVPDGRGLPSGFSKTGGCLVFEQWGPQRSYCLLQLSPLRPRGLYPACVISEITLCRLTGALSGQPSNFNEAYDNLIAFIQQPSNWDILSQELRGVGTVLVHCWAQTREKRAAMVEPNGFLYHLYEVLDCISPELMWAAVGPEGKQKRFYYVLKEQVSSFSKALLTLAEACYPMTELLAQHVFEDLMERCEALLAHC
ncbi:uncharacterized protein LOC114031291 [Vombatus ursinus]|uniref:uncharacterized protein LOC114031291 n=1 Tax=Vombatus ursinus TaxID=29139 RepID=UPI000FFD5864|nr:uncharacterized protein LOC114031291 [Vombatus ursinus]